MCLSSLRCPWQVSSFNSKPSLCLSSLTWLRQVPPPPPSHLCAYPPSDGLNNLTGSTQQSRIGLKLREKWAHPPRTHTCSVTGPCAHVERESAPEPLACDPLLRSRWRGQGGSGGCAEREAKGEKHAGEEDSDSMSQPLFTGLSREPPLTMPNSTLSQRRSRYARSMIPASCVSPFDFAVCPRRNGAAESVNADRSDCVDG